MPLLAEVWSVFIVPVYSCIHSVNKKATIKQPPMINFSCGKIFTLSTIFNLEMPKKYKIAKE